MNTYSPPSPPYPILFFFMNGSSLLNNGKALCIEKRIYISRFVSFICSIVDCQTGFFLVYVCVFACVFLLWFFMCIDCAVGPLRRMWATQKMAAAGISVEPSVGVRSNFRVQKRWALGRGKGRAKQKDEKQQSMKTDVNHLYFPCLQHIYVSYSLPYFPPPPFSSHIDLAGWQSYSKISEMKWW